MNKFNVGDRVRVVKNSYFGNIGVVGHREQENIGTIHHISRIDKNSNWPIKTLEKGQFVEQDLELITANNNNTFMATLKEKFISAFLTEPEKSYRKSGITNGDGVITDEGQQVFLTWLLKANPSFKTEVVDAILAEDKDSK
jgi:hypothetical protein